MGIEVIGAVLIGVIGAILLITRLVQNRRR
jgi:hypothetical protein